jgi:hypothetical protein
MQPKTIRVRPQDQTDLEYLTCITTLSEGAIMRALIGHAADFIRQNVLAQHPALRHDPEWVGGTGGLITVADRQAWATWCAHVATAPPREGMAHE